MKVYVVSVGSGLFVGLIYSLLKVRSPAPPVVALVGLLGILAGEQIIPLARQMMNGHTVAAAWRRTGCGTHMFGQLPGQGSTPERGIVNNVSDTSS
jgi:XapX domain-containing protein